MIQRRDVPQYLRDSAFYNNLDMSDEEEFEIPDDCYKSDLEFTCHQDLRHYLRTFQYWRSNTIHESAHKYMYNTCSLGVIGSLQEEFHQIEQIFTIEGV